MNQILKDKKYSVAVVATMSSGKSTFLNAMLGARILPAKQEACTAKVYSIEDDDNAESFQARCVKNGTPGPWEPASSDCLKAFNESDADEIEIIGNIKQIRNTRTGRFHSPSMPHATPRLPQTCQPFPWREAVWLRYNKVEVWSISR